MTGIQAQQQDWPSSVAAGYVRTLLDVVHDSHRAAAPAEVLAAAGLPGTLLDEQTRRLSHDAVSAIWLAAQRLTGDAALGLHVGEQVRPGSFDALGQLLMTCGSLREACIQAERFAPLVGGGGRFAASAEGDGIRLLYLPFDPDWPCRRQRVEAVLAATLTFTRWLCGRRVTAQDVRFRHAAPAVTDEHRRIFGPQLRFDAGDDSLLLGPETLALPVRQAAADLQPLLAGYASSELARLHSDGDPLRRRLADCLQAAFAAGTATGIEAMAAALHMTPRTLQRRLAERGTSLQAEAAALRCRQAKALLRQPEQSVAAIAARLGFADPANFHRAFRSWTGRTPGQWRREPQP
jgi:AraC-like DNA-binding protein